MEFVRGIRSILHEINDAHTSFGTWDNRKLSDGPEMKSKGYSVYSVNGMTQDRIKELVIESFRMDQGIYDEWINDIFTKTICEAKNRNQLMKAVSVAEEMGLKENEDFFLIKDNCLTELEPEEVDENGIGRTLTCIGFRPLPDDVAHQISRKYQLYK